jgi:TRAP-type C4-dicarboxylate transport system permease small subunit
MTQPPDPSVTPAPEQDGFIEDADANFSWRNIPLEGWICLPIFWVLAGVVFWQFFTRYALDNAAVWTEEVARQLLILLTFFGAGYAIRTRAHICINYFILKVSAKPRKFVQELSCLLQLAFYGYAIHLCLKIAKAIQFQTLMSVDLSKSVVYYAVAAAFAMMSLRTAHDMWLILRAYRAPEIVPGAGLPQADGNGGRQ